MMKSSSIVEEKTIRLRVNNKSFQPNVRPNWTLAVVLREKLGFTGVKIACDNGACGSCTVLVEGQTVLACMKLAIECDGKNILTIEGLSDGANLHSIQRAWLEEHGTQCGFCAPGLIMRIKSLLNENSKPTDEEIIQGLVGNTCRCTGYKAILAAVKSAAKKKIM